MRVRGRLEGANIAPLAMSLVQLIGDLSLLEQIVETGGILADAHSMVLAGYDFY